MVKKVLQLFLLCSLLLHVQSAIAAEGADDGSSSSIIAVNQEQIRSILQQHKKSFATPKLSSSSPVSYIIKPLSTIYSILPFESYKSHTFGSAPANHKKGQLITTTSITDISLPDISSTISMNLLPTVSMSDVDNVLLQISEFEVGKLPPPTSNIPQIAEPSIASRIDVLHNSDPSNLISANEYNAASISSITNDPAPIFIMFGEDAIYSEASVSSAKSDDTSMIKENSMQPSATNDLFQEKSVIIPSYTPSKSANRGEYAANLFSSMDNNEALHAALFSNYLLPYSSLYPSIPQAQRVNEVSSMTSNAEAFLITNVAVQQQNIDASISVSQEVAQTINNGIKLPTNMVITVKEIPDPEAHIRPCYRRGKKVDFSQYWIPKENEWDEDNDGNRVFLGGDAKMKLYDRFDKEIGMVPVDMYHKCSMEGTCLLENGDLINIESNSSDTFIKIGGKDRKQNVFGLGSGSQNLVPFVSVAANDVPYGQKLYISELDGLDLGNGFKHNGCVRVDDDSWSFDTCQIDFFVLSYVDYLWLDLEEKVSIRYADCKILNYVTKQHLSLVKASTDEKIIPLLLNAQYNQSL